MDLLLMLGYRLCLFRRVMMTPIRRCLLLWCTWEDWLMALLNRIWWRHCESSGPSGRAHFNKDTRDKELWLLNSQIFPFRLLSGFFLNSQSHTKLKEHLKTQVHFQLADKYTHQMKHSKCKIYYVHIMVFCCFLVIHVILSVCWRWSILRFMCSYVVLMPNKRQALVEYEDMSGSCNAVTYANDNQVYIAGRPCYINYSTSQKISRPGDSSDAPSVNNILLFTIMNPIYPITTVTQLLKLYSYGNMMLPAVLRRKCFMFQAKLWWCLYALFSPGCSVHNLQ